MRTSIEHKRRLLLLAATSLGVLTAAFALAGGAGAARTIELGSTKAQPKPSCPGSPCEAIGRVTGFQVAAAGQKNLFRAPADGQLEYWKIFLSRPSNAAPAGETSEMKFFNDFYGSPPRAGLAVLRKRKTKKKIAGPQFKLVRVSDVEDLTEPIKDSGQKTWWTFSVDPPLKVKKGDVVGLAIKTWAPAFAVDLPTKNAWRASRSPKRCNGAANIKKSTPHLKKGKFRRYGCLYKSARVLYRAGLVTP